MNMCTLENARTLARTHTRKHICLDGLGGLERRDGVGQAPSTDGCRASGEEQVWTANPQRLPSQRGRTCKRTQKCPLRKQIRIQTNDLTQHRNYQSNCKLSESFKGPAALARCSPAPSLPQRRKEMVKAGWCTPTAVRGRGTQQCDETRKAEHN